MNWWRRFINWWRRLWVKVSEDGNFEEEPVEGEAPDEPEQVRELLQLPSGVVPGSLAKTEDRYERYRGSPLMQAILPSGIWVVIKFSDALEAGGFEEEFKKAAIVKAADGEDAIRLVYSRDVSEQGGRANLLSAKAEDGRYVALDFYTGHRVEALVTGEWRAELEVA